MNYQQLREQVLQQLNKEKGGGADDKPVSKNVTQTLASIKTIIQATEMSLGDFQTLVAIEMCRDILQERGLPEDQIEKQLQAA